jgi:exodeoxyribonuclease VII large subunit
MANWSNCAGRLGVYEAARRPATDRRKSCSRAGQGALFEQFLRLKARLEAEGLFEAGRKRPLPLMPRAIGLVTSLGAAALHDVVTALQRRVPHIPVVLSPAAVQGAAGAGGPGARADGFVPARWSERVGGVAAQTPAVDVILLVRGGGSIEDLWAFNDEQLARTSCKARCRWSAVWDTRPTSPLPTSVADLRAPTPTAAAELVARSRATCGWVPWTFW